MWKMHGQTSVTISIYENLFIWKSNLAESSITPVDIEIAVKPFCIAIETFQWQPYCCTYFIHTLSAGHIITLVLA